ncbi:MAG: hypothetical protein AAB074_20520 [Planctomycetota bacterium]
MLNHAEERRDALHRVARWYERNGFRTFVNDGHRCSYPLEVEGRHLHPQLAVWEEQRLIRFVDVETAHTLNDLAPIRWWGSLGSSVALHVYVPFDSYTRAWDLRTRSRAMGARILTYDVKSVSDLIGAWTPLERIHERA